MDSVCIQGRTVDSHSRLLFQASILDLHSGALSMGESFVNIYK